MTIKSPSLLIPLTSTFRATAFVLFPSLLSAACAAELEDPEEYTTRIRPGVGASGVMPAQSNRPDPDPDVSPQTVSPSNTNVEPNQSDDETSNAVEPSPSVAPTPSVNPSSGGVSAECADVQSRVIVAKCSGASCHGSPGAPAVAFSDLASTTDTSILLDVPAKASCSDRMLIDSKSPADSAILSVVDATSHCSGSQMPFNGPYLNADEVRCLTEWVNAVAGGDI